MSLSLYETIPDTLPESWRDSVVVRHIDDPYGPAALAEPRKDWIEVGALDLADFPESEPVKGLLLPIKHVGEEFDVTKQPQQYSEAHLMFMGAARLILGPDRFSRARIFFDHFSYYLPKYGVRTYAEPHMDGTMPGGTNMGHVMTTGFSDSLGLRLVGSATNSTPTAVMQGSFEASDFEGETLTNLKSSAARSKVSGEEFLPINTLNLFAPAMVHHAQRASEEVARRHFLRWQVYI